MKTQEATPRIRRGWMFLLGLVILASSMGQVDRADAHHGNTLDVQVKACCTYSNTTNAFYRRIDIHGPKGYYRYKVFAPAGNYLTYTGRFVDAPYGDYRIRVRWCSSGPSSSRHCVGSDSVFEANRYGKLFSSWRHNLYACRWLGPDGRTGTC